MKKGVYQQGELTHMKVKQVKMTPEEVHASTLEWFFGLLEDWLGDLEQDQKQQVADWVQTDPEWTVIKLENRKKSQTNLAQLLRSNENLRENVHTWIHQPETHWTDAFKNRLEDKKKEGKEKRGKVETSALPHQRQHAANKLQAYIDDFLILSKQTPALSEK